MNKQQRDYEKAKQAKRRVEMKMEAREKSFLKGRGLMDSEGTEADSLYKIEDEALFDMACKNFDALPGMCTTRGTAWRVMPHSFAARRMRWTPSTPRSAPQSCVTRGSA